MAKFRILPVLVLQGRISKTRMSYGGGNEFDALARDSVDWLFAFADEEHQGSVCPSRSPVLHLYVN